MIVVALSWRNRSDTLNASYAGNSSPRASRTGEVRAGVSTTIAPRGSNRGGKVKGITQETTVFGPRPSDPGWVQEREPRGLAMGSVQIERAAGPAPRTALASPFTTDGVRSHIGPACRSASDAPAWNSDSDQQAMQRSAKLSCFRSLRL
jgi:hypothetical protein